MRRRRRRRSVCQPLKSCKEFTIEIWHMESTKETERSSHAFEQVQLFEALSHH